MAIAGIMNRFVIKELSGVTKPAQAGATVRFFKSADATPEELIRASMERTPCLADQAIVAMAVRGEQIRKGAERPPEAAQAGSALPDWKATRKACLDAIDTAARERMALDKADPKRPPKSFEAHYADVMMTPNGQRAHDWTR